jgi:branched-chain amino acid transport system substrate-binding protein
VRKSPFGGLRAVLRVLAFLALPLAVEAAEPIKIGFSMSLTGGLAAGGKSALLGMQVWAEDVNAKGGLLGRPVQLVFYDDQSTGSNVPGIYSKLLEIDKVDLVVSAYATNQIVPAMPVVMQKGMVFMALFGTGVNDKFGYDKYFQILPNGKETRFGPSLGFLETAMTMEPKTIALAGADAEYAQTVLAGAREKVKELGLQIVYDRSYPPNTVDFAPVVRSIQAVNPEIVYIASYPPDSVGIIRTVHEVGLKARMFGGGMIGLAFAPIKQQLGALLNGIVSYDVYVPEPTMKFPGIDEFLAKYRVKATAQGVDPLGFYLPPFAYAELQILAEAIGKVGSIDHEKIGAYIHANTFHTIVGDVTFAQNGEWEKSRILFVQYRGVAGSDVEQFKQPGKAVIVYPPAFASGKLNYPYDDERQ